MNELSLLDSIFDNVLGNAAAFTPDTDVTEDKKSYTIIMELPGMSEEDINIELNHNTLSISSKNEKKDEKDYRYLLRERRGSSFKRSFTLPQDVDFDSISASFKNGLLLISMNKIEEAAPKMIKIQAC